MAEWSLRYSPDKLRERYEVEPVTGPKRARMKSCSKSLNCSGTAFGCTSTKIAALPLHFIQIVELGHAMQKQPSAREGDVLQIFTKHGSSNQP